MADALLEAQSLPNGTHGGTQWSIVYDLRTCSATYYWQRECAKTYPFGAKRTTAQTKSQQGKFANLNEKTYFCKRMATSLIRQKHNNL